MGIKWKSHIILKNGKLALIFMLNNLKWKIMNEEILKEVTNQDYSAITKKIEDFLKDQVSISKTNGVILGMSGGIDSAVITFLCSRVLKEKTLALIMPDTKISPKEETEDALKIIDDLGIDYKLLDINLIVSEYSKY